jgi:long-subunit fatty acid transport protein
MRLLRRVVSSCLFGSAALWASAAQANLDPPAWADARSAALGGTGVAYTFNGASPYQNPATMQGITKMAFTLGVTPLVPMMKAPLDGPAADPVAAQKKPFPLFLAGGAYRVHERVVVGLAVYPSAGAGASYGKVASLGGNEINGAIAAFEVTPAVSFAILPNLSIGLGYRVSVAMQSASLVQAVPGPTGEMTLVPAEISLKGVNFAAMDAGLYYQPIKEVGFGFVYRSKMSASLSGTTKMGGAELDTKSSFTTPHSFRLGTAVHLVPDRVMATLEFRYLMFKDAMTTVDTTVTTQAGKATTQTQTYDFKDVYGVAFGVEVRPISLLALRLGYSETTSATPLDRPQLLMPAPAPLRTFHVGAGVRLEHWDIDLGAMYTLCSADTGDVIPPSVPGTYVFNSLFLASSVTYRR